MRQEKTMLLEWKQNDGVREIKFANDRSGMGNVISIQTAAGAHDVKTWGRRNDLPNYRDELLCDNNIIGTLINTKRNILLGNGLIAYKEKFVDGAKKREVVEIPKEIQQWITESEFYDNYLDPAPIQLFKHANIFAEFVTNPKGVASVMLKDCKYIRAKQKVNGRIPGYLYNVKWVRVKNDDKSPPKITEIPAYKKDGKQSKFMLHIADNVFNDGYYGIPEYWGGEEWIKVSNAIPVFHESNLKNGYSIRFLVTYPEDYFLDKYEVDQLDTLTQDDIRNAKKTDIMDKEAQAKQVFMDQLNNLLAGANNAGRALFAETTFNKISQQYEGIKIEPINFDLKDKSLLDLYEKTNQANISGQGIHPTLANIESQGKLSSGSEMRNAYLFYVLTSTPRPRRLVLKVWDLVCKLNGWTDKYPDLKWTMEDFEITKLDDDKSGVKPMIDNEKPKDDSPGV